MKTHHAIIAALEDERYNKAHGLPYDQRVIDACEAWQGEVGRLEHIIRQAVKTEDIQNEHA